MMKIGFLSIILFLAVPLMTMAQQAEENPFLLPVQLLQDAQYLEDIIFDAHIALDFVCDTNDLRSDFLRVKESLNDSMQASEFYAMLASVFYQIQDVHCALNLPLNSNDYYLNGGLYLPITVFMQDTCIYVKEDYFEEIEPGSRILSINASPVDSIMDVLKSVSPSDGDNDHTREKLASLLFPNLYPFFFNVDTMNRIQYVFKGDTLSKDIEGMNRRNFSYNQWFLNRYKEEDNLFRFGYSEDLNTAYMRIGSFMGGSMGEYNRFLRHSFVYMHSYNPDCLILDLRANPGGYSNRGRLLTRYLMPESYDYVYSIISKSSDIVRNEIMSQSAFQPEVMKFMYRVFSNKPLKTIWNMPGGYVDTTMQKKVTPFSQRLCYNDNLLIVMMDGLSASTTGLVINTLRKRPNTIFLGQPAACTIHGTFGQPTGFQLPNSGIVGQISILRFNQTLGKPSLQPIEPDIEIKPDIMDIVDGIDTQLQYVIDFIKSKKSD